MALNNRHNNIGRRIPTVSTTYNPPRKRNKYEDEDEDDKKKVNFKLWFMVVALIMMGYIFLNQVESYLIKNIYIEVKSKIPKYNLSTLNDKEIDDKIKLYQRQEKLPKYSDDLSVILIVVDSYSGKNMAKSNKVKEIIDESISKEKKQIKKKYYVLEIDNTIVMEDKLFKQSFPFSVFTKYKTDSVLDYGKLPEDSGYININNFIKKLKEKFPKSIISLNISNEIQDSIFAYNSLMDIGQLTKQDVIVTISPGNFEETTGLTERLKKFKYHTIQRLAFQMLEERVIEIKNFKIALNANKINASIRDNQELYNDYLKMKIRNGGTSNRIDREFIEKWIKKYPEMFYSDNAPMEYFIENKSLFQKEYESESQFANPKVNLEKTKKELMKELEK